MLPNLAVLEKKCKDLGLTVKPAGKKLGKEDCVRVLREHHMPEGGLPYEEITPMLCFAEWNLKESEQKDIWNGRNWGAQVKLNGFRLVMHFVKGVGVFAHSRTVSVKTWRYEELTSKLLIANFVPDFSASVDCEAIIEKPIDTGPYTAGGKGTVTKSSLHSAVAVAHLNDEGAIRLQKEQDAPFFFHIFDVMKIDGQDLRKLPLREREKFRTRFAEKIRSTEVGKFFVFPELVLEGRKEFAEKIKAAGGEGVILKNLSSPYIDSSSRPRTGWVKHKKRIEYDAFVSGFIRGEAGTGWEKMVGALEFSVHTDKGTHVLGYASNISLETRQKISQYDSGTDTVKLLPAMYGKVAEISGQDISARSFRLSHCTIDRWRPKQGPDAKRAEDCRVKMEDLMDAAEWVG